MILTTVGENNTKCQNECLNGGNCDSENNCICPDGFSGPTCEITLTTVAAFLLKSEIIPLGCNQNGEYMCLNNGSCNSDGVCICIHGYSGDKCENCKKATNIFYLTK